MDRYQNPYSGSDFGGFFLVLAKRFLLFLQGDIPFSALASDEIQLLTMGVIAISCSLVGTFLTLRRSTMLANSLSHTILLGIVLAAFFTAPILKGHQMILFDLTTLLCAAFGMGLITTFLTEFIEKVLKLQADASIGIVFTTLFAMGIIAATVLTRNRHIGLETVMGNADFLALSDLKLASWILLLNLLLFILFFKEYQLSSFDPAYARSAGFSTTFYNYLLMIQVAATVVAAFRAIGVLMVLSLISGPPLTARFLTHSLKKMLVISSLFGCLAVFCGVALSRHLLTIYGLPISTGGMVVCWVVCLFILAGFFRK